MKYIICVFLSLMCFVGCNDEAKLKMKARHQADEQARKMRALRNTTFIMYRKECFAVFLGQIHRGSVAVVPQHLCDKP